jgi:hypothetical protein
MKLCVGYYKRARGKKMTIGGHVPREVVVVHAAGGAKTELYVGGHAPRKNASAPQALRKMTSAPQACHSMMLARWLDQDP